MISSRCACLRAERLFGSPMPPPTSPSSNSAWSRADLCRLRLISSRTAQVPLTSPSPSPHSLPSLERLDTLSCDLLNITTALPS
ncbi:hypothetical protein JCM11251_000593 [Rhodosporidiobolus azoricus]